VVEGRALRILVFSEQPDGSNVDLERVFDPPRENGLPLHGSNVRYLRRAISGTLDDLDAVLDLARRAGSHFQADVILFDTALEWCRGLGGKSINDAEAMAEAGRKFRDLATHGNCAVLLIHHARKSGGDVGISMMGSGAIRASSDVNALVQRVDGHPTGVLLTFERRDPLRLIELAAGRQAHRHPRQAFCLELATTKGPDGEVVEFVRMVPMPEGETAVARPLDGDATRALDAMVFRAAMERLADEAFPDSDGAMPVFNSARLRDEAMTLIASGELDLPPGYTAPGDSRWRKAKRTLVDAGTWTAASGNRGFALGVRRAHAPTSTPTNYLGGLVSIAAPSMDEERAR
jgi:hypothetical protein